MIIDQYKKMKNLFLRQSYIDAWEDYQRSIRKRSFAQWDYIVLTASNEEQANAFRSQITYRQNKNVLPCKTKYLVLPDPDGKRVGSGGATLQVLRKLAEQEDIAGDFHNKRILVIHSGGDSKRVPQYSVCGKLFSPVPRELPDGRASTLFDEFLIGMAGVPSRFREGMLVLSGDVLLLFNPLQIDAQFHGAAAISMKSPVDVGKDHGVFLNNGKDYVKKFLHKQSIETLEKLGAVNTHGNVDLDTGAVLFDVNLMNALLSLVQTDGKIDAEKYARFVNEKSRISLYGDFLYPLAEDSTLEQYYKEQPEGTFCEELTECRTRIWEALHSFGMKLICLSPAEFIHFGTTRELLALLTDEIADYEYLDWKPMVGTYYTHELSQELIKKQWEKIWLSKRTNDFEFEAVKDINIHFRLEGEKLKALPALYISRQFGKANDLLFEIFNCSEIEKKCIDIQWKNISHLNALISMKKKGITCWDDKVYDDEIVKQMYKFDISVVITFPGIPKSQKKYGLSACILSENEKQAIRIMGVHRAIARGGILMELSCAEEELYKKYGELEQRCKNGTNNKYVWKTFSDLGKLLGSCFNSFQIEVLKRAKDITIFSDFPIGLAILENDEVPLQCYKSISYRPLTPLTRQLQLELLKKNQVYLGKKCKVAIAECIINNDENKYVYLMSDFVRSTLIDMEKKYEGFLPLKKLIFYLFMELI